MTSPISGSTLVCQSEATRYCSDSYRCLLLHPCLPTFASVSTFIKHLLKRVRKPLRPVYSCSFLFSIGAKHSDRLTIWYSVLDHQNVPAKSDSMHTTLSRKRTRVDCSDHSPDTIERPQWRSKRRLRFRCMLLHCGL